MREITLDEFAQALDRIARTGDGAILYRYLQRTLCGVMAGPVEPSALAAQHGRRIFASELMGLMASGIETHDRTDAIVSFRLRSEPRRESRGVARRIGPDDYVPGFDGPPEPR